MSSFMSKNIAESTRGAAGCNYMDPGLRKERKRSKLALEELTYFMEGEAYTKMKRKMRNLLLQDPVFTQRDRYYLTAEESFDRAAEMSAQYMRIKKKHGIIAEEQAGVLKDSTNQILPCAFHDHLFIPTIESLATKEQKTKWLPLANSYSIIGAYTQTELGHGSNIKLLEATATYDSSTEEFVLNCPTLTSIKWWSGALGHVATHALVVARLIAKGKDYGLHIFIVQLRSLEDHKPLPGVKLGDIGPRFGFNDANNGFVQLSNVHIPRDHMLMKYAQVTADGTYIKPIVNKINYASMVHVRVLIVFESAFELAKAVTIAVRYSVVRQQAAQRKGELETQLIDYQTQQYKLLPLLATAYACATTANNLLVLNETATSRIAESNFELLPELHATSCGLKAFVTDLIGNGIEVCRRACGGHGYSLASGFPSLFVYATTYQTLEGENTVLYLETARYLHKLFNKQLSQSQLPPNITYLATDYCKKTVCAAKTAEQFSDPDLLDEAYSQRVRKMVEIASAQYQEASRAGMDELEAWNESSVDWMNAVKAHCHYVVLKAFSETIQSTSLCPANLAILNALCSLYAVFGIVQCSGEFALEGYLSTNQLTMARQHLYSLLTVVRQEVVALVDAFDFPDELLTSVLGRYDGDVYKHLYEWAKKSPRNKSEVHDVYHKHLRPLIKGSKLSKL